MKIAFPDSEWAIVSASEHEWLTLTVSSLFPEDYFDKVLGAPNTKDQHFTDLEARNRRTLSIGDTVADFEISSKHLSDFVLVDDKEIEDEETLTFTLNGNGASVDLNDPLDIYQLIVVPEVITFGSNKYQKFSCPQESDKDGYSEWFYFDKQTLANVIKDFSA